MKKIPLIVVVSLLGAMSAADAAYPEKPVRIIVPSPPGGGIDAMGRLLAHKVTASLAKQVVVENRGGAGGNIGTEIAAKSARDGYTLLMAGSQLVANPSLYGKVGFDPVQDFDPISLLALAPNVLVVHPSLPVQSVRELIALAKNKPDAVGFAGAGPGSTPHLAGELFNMMAGVKMVHVPYRGTGPALTGILGGEASVMFMTATAAVPLVRAKRLRGIAVTSISRLPALPELPTIAESGLRGYQSNQWYGLLAPAGTPDEVLNLLNTQSVRFVQNPDTHQRLINEGAIPVGSTREQFASHIKTEIVKWAQVIKQSGARAD
jgi:tripartite-type tricarboxylate transporter receptor subunit TctC